MDRAITSALQGCKRHEMTSERNPHSDANLQIVKAKVIKVSLVFFSILVLCASVHFDAGKGPRGFSRHTQTRNSRSWSNEVEPRVHARHVWEKLHVPLLSFVLDLHKNVDHLINVLQLENLCGKRDYGNLYLRHDRDDDDIDERKRRAATVGSRLSSHREQRRICTTCQQRHRPPGKVLQQWNPYGHKDHGN